MTYNEWKHMDKQAYAFSPIAHPTGGAIGGAIGALAGLGLAGTGEMDPSRWKRIKKALWLIGSGAIVGAHLGAGAETLNDLSKKASQEKKAWFGAAIKGLNDVGVNALTLLIAATASVGGTGGWLWAKLNAHDKQDIDTIQKEYENERLKADLGYLSAKTKSEAEAIQNKQAPKPARVIA